ncbi:NAD-dependent epimerase/dehydratase family protein [Picrophilus oshimae]|uniref:UDP-glucose 4-epimerase n=1 Tax=Picrophilus torridus (strain ATCC 700027 / DSM 9790 / JCM 10055 / NBRC 100828 / KAW 2/3) TaxID=1122961 RepID=A0A8G2FW54_PICTO|nr:NAD-dependent epimerase/dehydratase family protein [Picrophilus oshimae]SMD30566.1 UDP-glucose 4-epimerase [Picrophilus oshimae DSM 9789]
MKGKKILITGGAGFIGSNMVERLVNDNDVTVIDFTDNIKYIKDFLHNKNFHFINNDLLKYEIKDKFDIIIHLAANSDVRSGSNDPMLDFNENVVLTQNLLEYMRRYDVNEMIFSSSSTVYGEASIMPTPESYGPCMPISSYGSSKLANEAFISAYSHYYGIKASMFRFANVVGKNSTHGVIHDFIMKLKNNPNELEILGDGTQRKSYIHVSDCINAMLLIHERIQKTDVINLGNHGTTSVKTIADYVTSAMNLENVRYNYTGGYNGRGWKGDIKYAELSIEKMESLGYRNKYDSDQSVRLAVSEILKQY